MVEKVKINGVYIIKDEFFDLMDDPYLKRNQHGTKSHYYCYKEENGIYWMIPLSSNVDKYEKVMKKRIEQGKYNDGLYIAKLVHGVKRAFLIQEIFPITKNFIESEYCWLNEHIMVTDERDMEEIGKKAKRILELIKLKITIIPTQPNIELILSKLAKY